MAQLGCSSDSGYGPDEERFLAKDIVDYGGTFDILV